MSDGRLQARRSGGRGAGQPAESTPPAPKVPAADQTLRILRLLAASRGPLPASVISAQLGLPRSTTYQLLQTLQEHGFVLHLETERRYGLGLTAVELSSAYERQAPLSRLGRPIISALVDRLGLSAHLSVPHGKDVLYLVVERAHGAPALVSEVDVRLPMQVTASGRAILASLPKAQVRALFSDRRAFVHRHDDDEIDSYATLRSVLEQTRARGYALEHGAVTPGFSSVAVAVPDHHGWPVAAVAVTYPDGQVDDERITAVAADVAEAAATLSSRIHGVAVGSPARHTAATRGTPGR